MARTTRPSTFQFMRALWRYHGRIANHGDRYQAEVATAVRTALDARVGGRAALAGYRFMMRMLLLLAIALALVAILTAVGLWQLDHRLALVGLLPLVGAGVVAWWRLQWGAPLDWLDEHADPEREVPLRELPARLRALAAETRGLANVPARLSDELELLAGDLPQP
jgi:hypothetical protein